MKILHLWFISLLFVSAPVFAAGGKITFTSTRDGNSEIYVMNADGSAQTNVSQTPSVHEVTPGWRNDGQKIVYARTDALWTMNANGSNQSLLLQGGAPMWPDFHPSGSPVIFSRPFTSDYDICKVNVDGTGFSQILSNNLGDYYTRWSPSGTQFTFYTFFGNINTPEVCIANADGSGQTRLTTAGDSQNADWSPDGRKIVFQSARDGNNEIYVMNADGTNQTRLTTNAASDVYATFSPDGSQIAFVSNRDGNNEIYVMNADGSGQTRLTSNPANDNSPSWGQQVPSGAPNLSLNDVTVNEGSGMVSFTVSLSAPSDETITVQYRTGDGSAQAPGDYTAVNNTTLTFSPRETSKTIAVPIINDAIDEPDESFTVLFFGATNAGIADATGVATIVDNDNPPTLSIADASVSEGTSGGTLMNFTVTLSSISNFPISVNFATSDGTAAQPDDYSEISGTLSIAAGQRTGTISVPIAVDNVIEANETLQISLSAPVNATIADGQAIGTIINDDSPQISVAPATIIEGNSGQSDLVFSVALSAPYHEAVSFNFATGDGTAKRGFDYVSTSGSRTFAPGQTAKTVVVSVSGDTVDEANETFFLNLSNPINATIAPPGRGLATIVDNDAPPVISINGVTVLEGNANPINAVFTLTLSAASEQFASVDVATVDGTAKAGADYEPVNRTIIFEPGQTSRTFSVPVIGDVLDEVDEHFSVALSGATNVTVPVPPVRNPTNGHYYERVNANLTWFEAKTAAEAHSVVGITGHLATVTSQNEQNFLTNLAGGQVTWIGGFQPQGSPEPAGGWQWVTGETFRYANWNPGEPNNEPLVGIVDAIMFTPEGTWNDASTEERVVNYYLVEYDVPSGAPGPGMVIITDNDAAPFVIANNAITKMEGSASNPGAATFNITLSAPSSRTIYVQYFTVEGTAKAGEDYVAQSGTLIFTPGQTRKAVSVSFIGDNISEANDTFFVNLYHQVIGAKIGDSQGKAFIGNDDGPGIFIDNAKGVHEGSSGTVAQNFTVRLATASTETVTVDWATANGPATGGAGPTDFEVANGRLTFAPGETQKTITIQVKGDTTVEPNERYYVNLTRPTFSVIADSQGSGFIVNDDFAAGQIYKDAPSQ